MTMVEVLTAHTQSVRNQRCTCGWRGDVSRPLTALDNIYAQHRAHLAEMLEAAGFGDMAEAWEEGGKAAIEREHTYGREEKAKFSNPYKAQHP